MDVVIGLLLFFGAVIGGIASNMIASELYDRSSHLAHWIVERAVTRLPENESARYREEWCAHLVECEGNFSKVWHAFGCNTKRR